MGLIDLELSSDGIQRRLVAKCDTEAEVKQMDLLPGATLRKDRTSYGLPADHTIVYHAQHFCKTMIIAPRLRQWMDKEEARTRFFANLMQRTDCLGDSRLWPFQRVDVDIMKRFPFVINNNPMGAGKTIEWLIATQGASSALAVVPKGLMSQWADKTEEWLGEEVTILHGTADQKRKLWSNRKRMVVTTYNTMSNFEPLRMFGWDAIGWDEGHRLAGKGDSQRSEAAYTMRASHRALLTATPVRKHPGYLYHPLHMAYPHAFTSWYHFVKRFCEMEETPWSVTPKGLKPSVEKMFHYLLSGIMISRDKKEILPFLPEKRSERVYVDMTPSQRKAYNEMHKELETTLRVIGSNNEAVELVARTNGSKFTKLRRLSLDPGMYTGKPDSNKTEYILDFCVDAPEKVVVFSWYKDYVDLLHTALLDKGINAVKMHGGLPDRDNDAADRSFKKDPNIQVIVGTIAKMGEGFDYPMATTVIFADTSYIPDDNRQGEERIWRPGQTKECRIIYLVTRKSVDEIVHKKVLERQDIVDEALAYKEVLRNISGVVA